VGRGGGVRSVAHGPAFLQVRPRAEDVVQRAGDDKRAHAAAGPIAAAGEGCDFVAEEGEEGEGEGVGVVRAGEGEDADGADVGGGDVGCLEEGSGGKGGGEVAVAVLGWGGEVVGQGGIGTEAGEGVGVKEGGGVELWAERGWAHGGCMLMERREGREGRPL